MKSELIKQYIHEYFEDRDSFINKIKLLKNESLFYMVFEMYIDGCKNSIVFECFLLEIKRRFEIEQKRLISADSEVIDQVCSITYKASVKDMLSKVADSGELSNSVQNELLDMINDSFYVDWDRIQKLNCK